MLNIKPIQSQLQELKDSIPEKELIKPSVSSAPVGWHIAHSLLVINNVFQSLKTSVPEEYRKSFSFWKITVMLLRKIPRGKAKSPSAVRPPEDIDGDFLQEQLKLAQANVLLINDLQQKAFFRHPFFKHLKRDETKKFLEIHTEHHLKIIREIKN